MAKKKLPETSENAQSPKRRKSPAIRRLWTDRERDVHFFDNRSVPRIRSWLLAALEGEDFAPLITLDYRLHNTTPSEQLFGLYRELPSTIRLRLQSAILESLREWSDASSLSVLAALTHLAGRTRSSEAIPFLEDYVNRMDSYTANPSELYYMRSTIIAVLRGFAPDPRIQVMFRRWFNADPQVFDPRFKAQLFLGLVECSRNNLTQHLEEFVEYIAKYRTNRYWRLGDILDELDEIVSPHEIFLRLTRDAMKLTVRDEFICLMLYSEHSPYYEVKFYSAGSPRNDYLSLKRKYEDDLRPITIPLKTHPAPVREALKQSDQKMRLATHPGRALRQKVLPLSQ